MRLRWRRFAALLAALGCFGLGCSSGDASDVADPPPADVTVPVDVATLDTGPSGDAPAPLDGPFGTDAAPAPYTETSIATMCDALTAAATTLALDDTDDGAS